MAPRCKRGHSNGRYLSSWTCVTCSATRSAQHHRGTYVTTAQVALWRDGEYQFLRDMGLTPREIGEKHGVKWESFQRTLHRRAGAKEKW